MSAVVVVDSGVANLASLCAALRDVGAEPVVSSDAATVAGAERIALPGVGNFVAGREALARGGVDEALREAAGRGTPILGICLGLQLLTEGSEEAPGTAGLGLVPGTCRRLRGARVPHLGWNRVAADPESASLADGYAAFANSYALMKAPAGARMAWSRHGDLFVAGLELGPVTACQFHPELSGSWGLALLRRWSLGEPLPARERGAQLRPDLGDAGLARRIIACLDVKDGRVVKGTKFQNLRDSGDPAERAKLYENQGADEIVVLDVSATIEARSTRLETVRRVRDAIRIPLTVGGGVTVPADARALLEAGADKVSVNSAAVARPELLTEMAERFGRQCVVLAIDARRNGAAWDVLTHGGRKASGREAGDWAERGERLGAGEILLTSWDRDGTRDGCDLDLLCSLRRRLDVPVIASGGVGSGKHVVEAFAAGADAVLAASIFHDDLNSVVDIKGEAGAAGYEVRR